MLTLLRVFAAYFASLFNVSKVLQILESHPKTKYTDCPLFARMVISFQMSLTPSFCVTESMQSTFWSPSLFCKFEKTLNLLQSPWSRFLLLCCVVSSFSFTGCSFPNSRKLYSRIVKSKKYGNWGADVLCPASLFVCQSWIEVLCWGSSCSRLAFPSSRLGLLFLGQLLHHHRGKASECTITASVCSFWSLKKTEKREGPTGEVWRYTRREEKQTRLSREDFPFESRLPSSSRTEPWEVHSCEKLISGDLREDGSWFSLWEV